ncbi:MAG: TetR/AcrR family transcriptional regulator [Microthrixaceae bacterium]|nr:TetR/AcrR family transcriptional regulator [Microthrixaceae bacterium]
MRLPAAERRRQLLAVALGVFAEHGFHATSMNDIADAAGVTKPVLYQHFRSKRELILELLSEIGADLSAVVGKATVDATSPRHQIEAGFASYFQWVNDNRGAFNLLFSSGTLGDPDFLAAAQQVEDAIADVVADNIVIAGLTQERRALLAHGIVGMAEGTCRRWMADPAAIDHVELADQLSELAWFGLRGIRSA